MTLVVILIKYLDFNSIKVQLEPNNSDDDQLYVGNFNSIKVQLELGTRTAGTFASLYFNSIKVQLEQSFPVF